MRNKKKQDRLKIGIDIDNVISDTFTAILENFNKVFNTNVSYEDRNKFDFGHLSKHAGVEMQKVEKFIDGLFKSEGQALHFHPFKDAQEAVRKWVVEYKHEVHYITARPVQLKKVTKKWLLKHGFFFGRNEISLFMYEKKYIDDINFKKRTVDKLKANILVEDSKEIAQVMNIPVFLLDRPWNKGELPKNVYRVFDWNQIHRMVKKLFL